MKDCKRLQTSLRGIAGRAQRDPDFTELRWARVQASSSEEPGAVVPHAGICAGGRPATGVPYRDMDRMGRIADESAVLAFLFEAASGSIYKKVGG